MKARDLYDVFKDYGVVDEVIIPGKRDKSGKKFGFVRFFEVVDADNLAVKLDNIFIGKQKLFVNFPRFHRGKEVKQGTFAKESVSEENPSKRSHKGAKEGTRDVQSVSQVRSFAAVTRNTAGPVLPRQQYLEYVCDTSLVEQRFNRAFVGKVREVGMTYNIQDLFDMEGFFGVKVTALGANLCLLEDREVGEVGKLLEFDRTWVDRWFSEIKKWDKEVFDGERVAWVRLFGLPCLFWNNPFFEFITKPVGVFIRPDANTLDQSRSDVARFLIRTRCAAGIDETFNVKLNGVPVRLKMVEDAQGPVRVLSSSLDYSSSESKEVASDLEMDEVGSEGGVPVNSTEPELGGEETLGEVA
ncbi:uncharacterized protein LOC131659847 [Vicia villosa]|uniref:uncharacterized protein LOC131659847 n=1 Tax=Vicia villosa TaxID=3911 RepID=UPI00273C81BB|nr:uncharacterized protein LOC131659847 [Vicia villosa]